MVSKPPKTKSYHENSSSDEAKSGDIECSQNLVAWWFWNRASKYPARSRSTRQVVVVHLTHEMPHIKTYTASLVEATHDWALILVTITCYSTHARKRRTGNIYVCSSRWQPVLQLAPMSPVTFYKWTIIQRLLDIFYDEDIHLFSEISMLISRTLTIRRRPPISRTIFDLQTSLLDRIANDVGWPSRKEQTRLEFCMCT